MSAKYLIRLDDACPTMNHRKWKKIEDLLDKYDIKPIVAVIPNNKDSSFNDKKISDNEFWTLVKKWQSKGWDIAMHGYTHVYVTKESGSFMKANKYSEFAGLSYDEQKTKIINAKKIFKEKNIDVKIWVAPAHTFDHNTLKAIKNETNIDIISDGIALYLYLYKGFQWIPVQIPRFIKLPFGYWTICLHPNEMSESDFNELNNALLLNKNNFLDIKNLNFKTNKIKKTVLNYIFKKVYNLILMYKVSKNNK